MKPLNVGPKGEGRKPKGEIHPFSLIPYPFFHVLLLSLAAGMAPAQLWQGPYQLTTDGASDINPSVCREWVVPNITCMVWQTNRNGNWDVYSRFCNYEQGNGWQSEEPVTLSAADDINPAVACDNVRNSPSYWCVWERTESPTLHTIRAAFHATLDQWTDTTLLATIPLAPGENAEPSAIVLNGAGLDTAWVVWRGHDTDGYYIGYAYHVGTAWSQPGIAVSSSTPLNHVRIGRASPYWPHCPLLVWETQDNIFFSEYVSGAWTTPTEVAPSPAVDRAPEVISISLMEGVGGPWIIWQSTRSGDTAIYATTPDSAGVAHRWCNSAPCGVNLGPSGVPVAFPTLDQGEYCIAVWTTNRNGNPDIYSAAPFTGLSDIPVDINPALDSNPVITAMSATEIWCCWQSNRSGNWDLWGSFIYATGIAERSGLSPLPRQSDCRAQPNPFRSQVTFTVRSPDRTSAERSVAQPQLRIFDAAGRTVSTLTGVRGPVPDGRRKTDDVFVWSGTDQSGNRVSDGIYYARFETRFGVTVAKLVKAE
jgi:hypothetical protein